LPTGIPDEHTSCSTKRCAQKHARTSAQTLDIGLVASGPSPVLIRVTTTDGHRAKIWELSGVEFTFRPGVTLAGAVVLAVLVSLGNWQVRRLQESTAWIDEMTERMSRSPVTIEEALADPDRFTYRRVVAEGLYDVAESVLLEHQVREGQSGVHILTPLRMPSSERALLVDRGYVARRDAEPFLEQDAQTGPVRVEGFFRAVARRRLPEGGSGSQLRWHRVDPSGIELQLPYRLEAGLLIRDDDGTGAKPLGGIRRPASRVNHLHYAITWYGTAAVLVAVVLALQLRRGAASSGAD
jgi:surfeit locus 1 family protein